MFDIILQQFALSFTAFLFGKNIPENNCYLHPKAWDLVFHEISQSEIIYALKFRIKGWG